MNVSLNLAATVSILAIGIDNKCSVISILRRDSTQPPLGNALKRQAC